MRGSVKESKAKTFKGKKLYEIRYELPRGEDGKRRQKKESGFTSRTKAEEALSIILAEIGKGTYIDKRKKEMQEEPIVEVNKSKESNENVVEELSVKDVLVNYLQYIKKKKRETTYEGFSSYVNNHIIPKIGHLKVNELRVKDVEDFYDYLETEGRLDGKGGLSGTSRLQIHRILFTAFARGKRRQEIEVNPIIDVEIPTKSNFKAGFLEENEIELFWRGFENSDLLIAVIIATIMGLRRGEVLGLTWDNVNFSTNTITIEKARVPSKENELEGELKTLSSERELPFDEILKDILLKHKENQKKNKEFWGSNYIENDFVVTRDDGSLDKPRNFSKRYGKVVTKKNLKKIRFHDLRHTCGILLLGSGVSLKIISEWLGHSGIQITSDIYLQSTKKLNREVAQRMDGILKRNVQL